MVISMLEYLIKNDQLSDEEKLKGLCDLWGGKNGSDDLNRAFAALHDAYSDKGKSGTRVSSLYWGVTARHITRPLVIAPNRLSDKEEAYFLPFVFNVSKEEARNDFTDIHGSHLVVPEGAVKPFVAKMINAAEMFEKIDASAPKKAFFAKMATSIRISASIIRSCGNFADAQAIRDRNQEKLSAAPHFPSKVPTFTGDPDFIPFMNVARDELDNTAELINLLQKRGGLDLITYAKDPLYEDRFVLGPDLVQQLKKKRKVMLDHWTDIEGYLASPFK
jgi:hypothetical protein